MDVRTQNSLLIGSIVLIVLAFAAYLWLPPQDATPQLLLEEIRESEATSTAAVPDRTPTSTSTADMNPGRQFTRVKIALLDTVGSTDGVQRACDKIVMIDRDIAPTSGPLGGTRTQPPSRWRASRPVP